MIYTDIDIKDDLWRILSGSALAGMISGKVYKDKRPINSDSEDIVIAVIARDAGQMQEAIANVNIYVPDLRRGQEAVEDSARLRTLAISAVNLLEYIHLGNRIIRLDSQEIMEAGGIDWHIINNRLRIRLNNEL